MEAKWQKIWEETKLYKTKKNPKKDYHYVLTMLPYTSGDLHTGHWYAMTGPDIMARMRHMQGKNVLHPMGFDAFGLPAENAAIKNNIPPAKWTRENIASMTKQLKRMGNMYDWEKALSTADPDYYKWTQWFFLLFYKNGLAYRKKGLQNWCPKDQTVLANEQVVGGKCERCGTIVEKKELEQWFFKITDYAARLLKDLDKLEWPESVVAMQKNWIGRKEGIDIVYKVLDVKEKVTCFTTRPDTNFGATFIVLAPEHSFVNKIITGKIESKGKESRKEEIKKYLEDTRNKSELERQEEGRTKTGVFSGFYAKNELNGKELPIWISDFVLAGFGTGAVVGVPGHDLRDFEFATTFKLPIIRVVVGPDGDTKPITEAEQVQEATGTMVNSNFLDELPIQQATKKIMDYMEEHDMGKRRINYRLRDWLISRQRYWGAPIPIVYCDECGIVPVPEADLPVKLPEDVKFKPTGQSPLVDIPEFVNTTCPKCGGKARRETDTMDTFVDSSWYFLRYPDPNYQKRPFNPDLIKKWLPVTHYLGGIEHAILHLLYARFFTKVLHDYMELDFDEPFSRLSNQGMILGPDGQKMSKSRGNVVNPDEVIDSGYGIDTFRMFLMFLGPWELGAPVHTKGLPGLRRYLDRVWTLIQEYMASKSENQSAVVDNPGALGTLLDSKTQKTVKKVTDDIDSLNFNTAISALMGLVNSLYKLKIELPFNAAPDIWPKTLETLLKLLAPFAPHITEELWSQLGFETSIHLQEWPQHRAELIREELVNIVVQVNGKVRASIVVAADISEEEMVKQARSHERVKKHLGDKTITKTITVPGKLVNFVIN